MQIKTTMRYCYTPIRMGKIQSTDNSASTGEETSSSNSESLSIGRQDGTAALEGSAVSNKTIRASI